MSEAEKLLSEIERVLRVKLENCREEVKRIIANLAVAEEEYKSLIVSEALNAVVVDAQFAFPPHTLHTPEGVKEKALKLLQKKLERDMRLYALP